MKKSRFSWLTSRIRTSRSKTAVALVLATVVLAGGVQVAYISGWFTSRLPLDEDPRANAAAGNVVVEAASMSLEAVMTTESVVDLSGGAEEEELFEQRDGIVIPVEDGANALAGVAAYASLSSGTLSGSSETDGNDGDEEQDSYAEDSADVPVVRTESVFLIRDNFRYEYVEQNFPEVFVRFRLNEETASDVLSLEAFCYVDDWGGLAPMPRLEFADEEPWFYYPYAIERGQSFGLAYALVLPAHIDENWAAQENYVEYEIVQAVNNLCMFRWNVEFLNGDVYPVDTTDYIKTTYMMYTPEAEPVPVKNAFSGQDATGGGSDSGSNDSGNDSSGGDGGGSDANEQGGDTGGSGSGDSGSDDSGSDGSGSGDSGSGDSGSSSSGSGDSGSGDSGSGDSGSGGSGSGDSGSSGSSSGDSGSGDSGSSDSGSSGSGSGDSGSSGSGSGDSGSSGSSSGDSGSSGSGSGDSSAP